MRYFQKNSSNHIFAFLANVFWILESSDWLTQLSQLIRSLQHSKKFAKKGKNMIWRVFWKNITFLNVMFFKKLVKWKTFMYLWMNTKRALGKFPKKIFEYIFKKLVKSYFCLFWQTLLNFGDFWLVDSAEQPIRRPRTFKKIRQKYDLTSFFENSLPLQGI